MEYTLRYLVIIKKSKLKPYNYYGQTKLKAEKIVKDLKIILLLEQDF